MQDSYNIYRLLTLNKIAMRKSHEVHVTPLTPEEMKKEGAIPQQDWIYGDVACKDGYKIPSTATGLHAVCPNGRHICCTKKEPDDRLSIGCVGFNSSFAGIVSIQCGKDIINCNESGTGECIGSGAGSGSDSGTSGSGSGGSSGSGGMKPENPSGTFATHPHWTPGKSGGLL